MKTVAISACLLGKPVRYDGQIKEYKELKEILNDVKIIEICPEVFGGLSVPRKSSEKKGGRWINEAGVDVTQEYMIGSNKCLNIIKDSNVDFVILKSKSPACGKGYIYDGSFTRTLINDNGSLCELLLNNNIKVYTEKELDLIKNEVNE